MAFRWLVAPQPDLPEVKAIVVFHDQGSEDHPVSRFLKVGFRHVFAAMQVEGYWILVDGAAGIPSVKVLAGSDYDLATLYRSHGMTVVETKQRRRPLRAPFVTYNCVGLVKAALCIRSLAVTPHQLYRHLLKEMA